MEDVQYKELKDMIHTQYKEEMDAIHAIDKNLAEFKGKSEAEHHAVRTSIKDLESSLDRTKSSIYDGLEPRVKHVEMELEKGKSNMKLLAGLFGGAIVVFEIVIQNWNKLFS